MTYLQKNNVNKQLARMYYDSRLNTSDAVRNYAASELVGAIEILAVMGCTIGGYINGKLVSKPYIAEPEQMPAAEFNF